MSTDTGCSNDGGVVFSIDPRLQNTIPSHQFIKLEVSIDSKGQQCLSNTTDKFTATYSNEGATLKAIPGLG